MSTTLQLASLDFAERLFTRGTDCFGPRQIARVFGHNFGPDTAVPPIPFSEDELNRARELGQYLVLDVNVAPDGTPLSFKKVYELLGDKSLDGKFLYDTSWYQNEPFFSEQLPAGWRLVSREVIPGSASENYLGQTAVIVEYLRNQVYQGKDLPKPYQAAVDEFEAQKKGLKALMERDWAKAAEQLAALQINQLFRETPGQVGYRLALYAGINNERLLPNLWTWTKSRSSDGLLVSVGGFDSRGASVDLGDPRDSASDLGVCFSRSAVPEL